MISSMLLAQIPAGVPTSSFGVPDVISIIVGLVSLIVTLLAFAAAMWFYMEGRKLQAQADATLTKIQQQSENITSHFSGMFDKALEAAIARKDEISDEFESLQERLSQTADTLTKKLAEELKGVGQSQKTEMADLLRGQLESVAAEVQLSRQSLSSRGGEKADSLMRLGSVRAIIQSLADGVTRTDRQIAETARRPLTQVINRLPRMLEAGLIEATLEGNTQGNRLTTLGKGYAARYQG